MCLQKSEAIIVKIKVLGGLREYIGTYVIHYSYKISNSKIMHYLLMDLNPMLVEAWEDFFKDYKNVVVLKGDITEASCDAIVSPANSFGFMDGGVDYALSMRLGWDLQFELQKRIKALPEGELLVGKSMVIETNDELIPYLISSPTMRVPMNYNISTSVNAYLAMKATLIAAKAHEKIEYVAIPGLCTGVGGLHPMLAARQMHQAYLEIELGQKMDFASYPEAQKYHLKIHPSTKIFH